MKHRNAILAIVIILNHFCKLNFLNSKLDIKKPYKFYHFISKIEEPDDQLSFHKNCPSIYLNESKKLSGCVCNISTISSHLKCSSVHLIEAFPIFKFLNSTKNSSINKWNIDLRCKNFTILSDIYKNIYDLKSVTSLDLSYDEDSHCNNGANNKQRTRLKKIYFQNFTGHCNQNDTVMIYDLKLSNNYINDVYVNTSSMVIENIHLEFNNLTYLTMNQSNFNDLETKVLNLSYNLIANFDENLLYSSLKSIDLSHNKLERFTKFLDNSKFMNIQASKLIHLNLSHNLLHHIPFNKETNLTSLQTLNLSSNFITEINENDFFNFPQLRYLYLDKNQISSIHEYSFKYLNNLELLDLSSNSIKNLTSVHLFEYQIFKLKYLNLNMNLIELLNLNTLKYLQNCVHFFLNNNKLTKIRNYTFGYMNRLVEIDLSMNSIHTVDIDAFNIHKYSYLGPGLIEKLDLSSNLIRNLPANLFQYLTNLRYLLLNKNLIEKLDTNLFNTTHSLIHIDLSLNLIRDLQFLLNKNFKTVKYLKLNNNLISQVYNNQFTYFTQLRQLDLSSNHIRIIGDCAFYHLKDSIRKLILNHNQIRSINSCAFQYDFKHIRFLHLVDNPINCTANCHFFNILQNRPYALNYFGSECLANNFDLSILNCTDEHYKNITLTCEKRKFCVSENDHIFKDYDTVAEEHVSTNNKLKNELNAIYENEKIKLLPNNSNRIAVCNINLFLKLLSIIFNCNSLLKLIDV